MRSGITGRQIKDPHTLLLSTSIPHQQLLPCTLWIETKPLHYNSNWLLLNWKGAHTRGKHTNAGYFASYSSALQSFPNGKLAECRRIKFVCAFSSSWDEIIESVRVYTQMWWHFINTACCQSRPAGRLFCQQFSILHAWHVRACGQQGPITIQFQFTSMRWRLSVAPVSPKTQGIRQLLEIAFDSTKKNK